MPYFLPAEHESRFRYSGARASITRAVGNGRAVVCMFRPRPTVTGTHTTHLNSREHHCVSFICVPHGTNAIFLLCLPLLAQDPAAWLPCKSCHCVFGGKKGGESLYGFMLRPQFGIEGSCCGCVSGFDSRRSGTTRRVQNHRIQNNTALRAAFLQHGVLFLVLRCAGERYEKMKYADSGSSMPSCTVGHG